MTGALPSRNVQNSRVLSNPYNLKILKIRLNTKTNMFPDGIDGGKSMITTVGCFLSSNQVKSRPDIKGIASVLRKPGETAARVAVLFPQGRDQIRQEIVSFQPLSPFGTERVEKAADLIDGRFGNASRSCLR
jgi:hypothetical protein